APVNANGDVEFLDLVVKRIEIWVIEVLSWKRGRDAHSDHAQLFDCAPSFADCSGHILQRDNRNGFQAIRVRRAKLSDVVVTGFAKRQGKSGVAQRTGCKTQAAKDYLYVDAFNREILYPGVGVRYAWPTHRHRHALKQAFSFTVFVTFV